MGVGHCDIDRALDTSLKNLMLADVLSHRMDNELAFISRGERSIGILFS